VARVLTGSYGPELSGLEGVVTNAMSAAKLPGVTLAVAHYNAS
jgi:hypothetical protein